MHRLDPDDVVYGDSETAVPGGRWLCGIMVAAIPVDILLSVGAIRACTPNSREAAQAASLEFIAAGEVPPLLPAITAVGGCDPQRGQQRRASRRRG